MACGYDSGDLCEYLVVTCLGCRILVGPCCVSVGEGAADFGDCCDERGSGGCW